MFNEKAWQTKPLAWQMANIASEICKSFSRKAKGDSEFALEAAKNTLTFFDATLFCVSGNGRREISRMRSVFCDTFFDFKQFNVSPKSIEAYFLPFVLQVQNINEALLR